MSETIINETKGTDVVMISEPESNTAPKEEITREGLRAQGWSARELDAAEKRGYFKKKEDKAEVKADAETQPEAKANEDKAQEPKAEDDKAASDKRAVTGSWIDFELTPEKEKQFFEIFPPGTPQNGTYLRMKTERRARQAAEAKIKELESKYQDLERRLSDPKREPVLDENGKEIDPDDKPLTVKQLKEMKEREEAERRQAEEENRRGAMAAKEAILEQEQYAKSVYRDYDDTVKLAKEVIQNVETLFPNKWERDEAIRLMEDLQIAVAQAHNLGFDDRNAALISYQLGKLHPNWGKQNGHRAEPQNDGKPQPDPKKANGSLTPEQMKRMEQNTQRRTSSASIPGGGGSRAVSVEDLTARDVLKMSPTQRANLKKNHPEKWAEIMRG